MRLGTSLKSVRLAVGELLRAAGREIGPREHAILAVTTGVYILARALWPAGALGVALVVGGGLQLGVILWTQAKALAVKKEAAP
jgi:hypothetical protein